MENSRKRINVRFVNNEKYFLQYTSRPTYVEIYEGSYTKKYHEHVPCSFPYKVVCIDVRFTKSTIIYRGKNDAYEFIKAVLKEHKCCKKNNEKTF